MPNRRTVFHLTFTAAVLAAAPAHPQRAPMTPDAWRADLRFAADSFLARDRSFDDEARVRFGTAVNALSDSADRLSNEEMIVGLARAVAMAENAHTRLYLVRNRSEVRRLPVRVWWFDDGLFVVRAQPGYEALLGARLLRICGRAVDEVRRLVRPLYAGNDAWGEYMAGYTMTSPEILAGVHVCAPGTPPSVAFVGRDGRRGERVLEPLPLRRSTEPTEAWWDLSPLHPGVQGPWASALPADAARLPLYLRDPLRAYWIAWLPAERTLYIQHNRAVQMRDATMEAFAQRVLAALAGDSISRIVLDERFNTGGNLQIARPFVERLAAAVRGRRLPLYVITGRATFSAGLTHVAQIRQWARATIVGDGPGEGMEFWSEGDNLVMPNSGLTLHFADKVHSYGVRKTQPRTPYLDTELFADRVTPEIRVRMTSRDYFTGRDPALEAILRRR